MLRVSFLMFLSFSLLGNPVHYSHSINVGNGMNLENKEKNLIANKMLKKRLEGDQNCLIWEGKRVFKNLEEAEKYHKCLLEERKILVGDFYGINQTAYRYVNIFNRLGYIRYKIAELDKKIKITRLSISELKKKLRK